MASLLAESASDLLPQLDEERLQYMAFTEAVTFAEHFSSPLYDLQEETWRELYLRPSPPLSPDNTNPPSPVEKKKKTQSESQAGIEANPPATDSMADSLLSNIMEYEQIMDALQEAEYALSSGSSQPAEDLLIQDCMWSASSSDDNKPNNNTVGGGKDKRLADNGGAVATAPSSRPTSMEISSNSASGSSAECCAVKPSAVFPNLHHAAPQTVRIPTSDHNLPSTTTTTNRLQVMQSSSESEEEIDVVTVDHSRSDSHESDDIPRRQITIQHAKPVKPVPNASNQYAKTGKKPATQTRGVQSSLSPGATTTTPGNKAPPTRKKRYGKRHVRIGSQDGNESDEEARRASHNVLERKRRNDLKNSFDILRTGIPDLEENIRAPKVVILRKAVEYIKYLQVNDRKIESDYNREQKKFNKLKEKLMHLKKRPIVTI